jgi:hypothetical protein
MAYAQILPFAEYGSHQTTPWVEKGLRELDGASKEAVQAAAAQPIEVDADAGIVWTKMASEKCTKDHGVPYGTTVVPLDQILDGPDAPSAAFRAALQRNADSHNGVVILINVMVRGFWNGDGGVELDAVRQGDILVGRDKPNKVLTLAKVTEVFDATGERALLKLWPNEPKKKSILKRWGVLIFVSAVRCVNPKIPKKNFEDLCAPLRRIAGPGIGRKANKRVSRGVLAALDRAQARSALDLLTRTHVNLA